MSRIERAYQFDVFRFDGIAISAAYPQPRLRPRQKILTGRLLLLDSGRGRAILAFSELVIIRSLR
ncbi:MAG: hypothetical protein IT366_12120 [Candidatus Hydrogenedentes bacterium]|nr:hypothetical protein [Candidatus Hydrogenedentota bacterium]